MSIPNAVVVRVAAAIFMAGSFSYGDEWDPVDDSVAGATELLVNETNQSHGLHNLNSGDTNDWFSFSLLSENIYFFESTGESDTLGYLYSDPAGINQVATDDDGGEGLNFSLSFSPPESTTYYLKIEAYQGGDADYSLSYNGIPLSDQWDPLDDTGAGATVLAVDQVEGSHGAHILSVSDTNDWFHFSLVAGTIYLFESEGSSDTIGYLYEDTTGTNELAHSDDDGENNNFRIFFTPAISGDYYLKIASVDSGYAIYSLKYKTEISDHWDPVDDTYGGSTHLRIDPTDQAHGEHLLSAGDVYDWFVFNLVSGIPYVFEAISDGDTVGSLYSAEISEVASGDDEVNLNFKIGYVPSVSGDYYLRVHGFEGGDLNYHLKYKINDLTDADGDQMPDAWETHAFGTNVLATGNWDGDVFNNLEEYIAGTDPTNSASFFAVTNGLAGGSFVVEWSSVSAREYAVLWAESLTNGFVQLGDKIDHPQNSYTDTTYNAKSSGFYKVEVQLQ